MMGIEASEGKRHIQSVFRALKILECVAQHGSAVGLTDISKEMGLSKSTVHGLIATLEQYGYMQQDGVTGKYSLGLKAFEIGQAYVSSLDLREVALPDLRELSLRYQETAHLAVLSGEDVVYIDKFDGSRSIGIRSRIGGRNPAYCTGVGKALLSGLSDSQIQNMYQDKSLEKYTENTVVELIPLLEQIRQVRKVGYAFDAEEIEMGLQCIAAPIKDNTGMIIAAISLSGPSSRLPDMKDIATDVAKTAMQISLRLGYKNNKSYS